MIPSLPAEIECRVSHRYSCELWQPFLFLLAIKVAMFGMLSVSSTNNTPRFTATTFESLQWNNLRDTVCSACRTSKVKCDRQRPKCGRCSHLLKSCVYDDSSTNDESDPSLSEESSAGQSQTSATFRQQATSSDEALPIALHPSDNVSLSSPDGGSHWPSLETTMESGEDTDWTSWLPDSMSSPSWALRGDLSEIDKVDHALSPEMKEALFTTHYNETPRPCSRGSNSALFHRDRVAYASGTRTLDCACLQQLTGTLISLSTHAKSGIAVKSGNSRDELISIDVFFNLFQRSLLILRQVNDCQNVCIFRPELAQLLVMCLEQLTKLYLEITKATRVSESLLRRSSSTPCACDEHMIDLVRERTNSVVSTPGSKAHGGTVRVGSFIVEDTSDLQLITSQLLFKRSIQLQQFVRYIRERFKSRSSTIIEKKLDIILKAF